MTQQLLALDLGTRTGWAHSAGPSGVQDFSPRRGDSPGMRWLEFGGWLRRILEAAPTDVIVYEQAHHRGGAATHVAHALISQVEAVAAERGIEITSRHSSAVKKRATGRGNADKPSMMAAAELTWPGVKFADDNQVDAMWLLDLVTHELSGDTESDE